MNVIDIILRRKVSVAMGVVGLCLLGAVSWHMLPLEMMPSITYPQLIVQVNANREMNPEYLERTAVVPLEGAAGTLPNIVDITSAVDQRRGTINLSFDPSVNSNFAYLKLLERVNEVAPSLGDDFTVQVLKVDTESQANLAMRLQVRGEGGLDRIRAIIEKTIVRELESVDGMASVTVTGGRNQSVEIVLNPEVAQAYGITPGRVRTLVNQSAGGRSFVGNAVEGGRRWFVTVVSDYTDISQLENLVVNAQGPVYLRDVASVSFGQEEQDSISRVNGMEAITLQLVQTADVNMIDFSHNVRAVVDRLNSDLAPQGVEVVIQTDTAEEMERNINLIIQLAITGGLLAVIVLWIFLRNIRLVAIVLLSMPVSILIAMNFFYAFGITLNSLTLVGIALVVGMLLSNSVVVLESIYRYAALGRDRHEAVVRGTTEVWRSITASTLTTITVFLPFVFSSDFLIRSVGRHIGVSIVSTLVVSLLAAITIIPAGAHTLLGLRGGGRARFSLVSYRNRAVQVYTLLLKTALRHPVPTAAIAVVAFFISITAGLSLSMDVSRELDLTEFSLYVTMPQGSTLERTDGVVTELETMVGEIGEIGDVLSTIYESEASITLILKDKYERIAHRSIAEVREDVQTRIRDFRGADVSLSQPRSSQRFSGGGGSDPLASMQRLFGIGTSEERLVIKGSDFPLIREVAADLEYYLDQLDTVASTSLSIPGNRPELHLYFDRLLMGRHDVSVNSVTSELASYQTQVSAGTTYRQGTDEYDIVIRNATIDSTVDEDKPKTADDLRALQVTGNSGAVFNLERLARLVFTSGLSRINRVNQERQVEITYRFETEVTDSKAYLASSRDQVDAIVASISIPPGIAVEVVHDTSQISEFHLLIGAAFLLIFMILASVFESFTQPVAMMFTIPLAAIGSIWALVLTGNSLLNANALIGFLILLGVVVNNGIILIDYTNILRRRGYRVTRALMTSGRARVRPILITAITTIVAMVPLAMGTGEYVSRIGAPFAITVIGGLALSTLFTLVYIPTMSLGLESAVEWIRGQRRAVKAAMAVVYGGLAIFILWRVDGLFGKAVFLTIATVGVPGMTWLMAGGLRRAQSRIVPEGEDLSIMIRRLVKIYDGPGRFIREWKQEERLSTVFGAARKLDTIHELGGLLWQMPLAGFLCWFTYVYLGTPFWVVIWSVVLYLYLAAILHPAGIYLENRSVKTDSPAWRRIARGGAAALRWGFPVLNVPLYLNRQVDLPAVVFVMLAWYGILAVMATAQYVHNEGINIMRLTGRFAGVRRLYFTAVGKVPFIGRMKRPFYALDGVSLTITSGMFGLLGPNGAGKTTLMRAVCGTLNSSLGGIRIGGLDCARHREELQGLIGYLPQDFGAYEMMTAYEFLDYLAILKGIYDPETRRERIESSLASVHLADRRDHRIGSFSGGMKQRMGIALTLLHLPRILVVDEPTAGLDPRERIRFRNLLVELSRGRIVIFSTHIIEDISSSCNRLAVLSRGLLRYLGEPMAMTDAARGKVWQFTVDEDTFELIRRTMPIVHHMRVDEGIRVRTISETPPRPDAVIAEPTLEDAYLWFIAGTKGAVG